MRCSADREGCPAASADAPPAAALKLPRKQSVGAVEPAAHQLPAGQARQASWRSSESAAE
jgi:hypothetical protein